MSSNRSKPITLDQLRENIEFAAQRLLEVPADERPAMLESTVAHSRAGFCGTWPGIGIGRYQVA